MKKVLFLLLAFMATVAVSAQQVSRQQALQKARLFMPGKQFGEAKSFARGDCPTDMEPFYIFNAKDQKGFVIVSGDDRTEPILGYSDKGEITEKNMPENLKYWLECYEIQMKSLGQDKVAGSRGATQSASKTAVDPLIRSKWDQDTPYNYMCPSVVVNEVEGESITRYVDIGEDGYDSNNRCVSGCVATAMAQVMRYWEWPAFCVALDKYDIEKKVNGEKVVDHSFHGLDATTFDWQSMALTYSSGATGPSADEVAKLMRYCGQAVKMNYRLAADGGSGANVYARDMVNTFGYSKNAKDVKRKYYTVADWEDLIYNELFCHRPVLYAGRSASEGHQFICDGYDGNGLFHFNWGWSGMCDGYFVLSLANPDDLGNGGGTNTDGFSYDQEAIIGLQKPIGEDVETPDIYGLILDDESWITEYSRSSSAEDFENVSLPGSIRMNYNFVEKGIWPDYSIDYAWGLYQDGVLVNVYGTASVTLTDEYDSVENSVTVGLGAGLDDGIYMLRQVYRPQGCESWRPCLMQSMSYIKAAISDNTLTLSKANEEEFFSTKIQVNSVAYSPYPLEAGKAAEVTVIFTNNGDAFQELIRLQVNSQYVTYVCGSVEPGQTGTVKLHFVPDVNGENVPVRIIAKGKKDIEVWSGTVNIEAPKPQSLSGTMTVDRYDVDNNVLSGNRLCVHAQLNNEGTNIYDNQITLGVFKYIEGQTKHPSFASTSMHVNIQPGETKDFVLTVPNLNFENKYFFHLYYYSEGKRTKIKGKLFTLIPLYGDANGSGDFDTDDVNMIVDYIMGRDFGYIVFENADMDNDGKVDAVDLVKLIDALPK